MEFGDFLRQLCASLQLRHPSGAHLGGRDQALVDLPVDALNVIQSFTKDWHLKMRLALASKATIKGLLSLPHHLCMMASNLTLMRILELPLTFAVLQIETSDQIPEDLRILIENAIVRSASTLVSFHVRDLFAMSESDKLIPNIPAGVRLPKLVEYKTVGYAPSYQTLTLFDSMPNLKTLSLLFNPTGIGVDVDSLINVMIEKTPHLEEVGLLFEEGYSKMKRLSVLKNLRCFCTYSPPEYEEIKPLLSNAAENWPLISSTILSSSPVGFNINYDTTGREQGNFSHYLMNSAILSPSLEFARAILQNEKSIDLRAVIAGIRSVLRVGRLKQIPVELLRAFVEAEIDFGTIVSLPNEPAETMIEAVLSMNPTIDFFEELFVKKQVKAKTISLFQAAQQAHPEYSFFWRKSILHTIVEGEGKDSNTAELLEYFLNQDIVLRSAEGLTAEMLGNVHSREALLGVTPLMLCQSHAAVELLLSHGANINETSLLGLPVVAHLLASPRALSAALAAQHPPLQIMQPLSLPYLKKMSLLDLWTHCVGNFSGPDRLQDGLAESVKTLFESDDTARLSYDIFAWVLKTISAACKAPSLPYHMSSSVVRLAEVARLRANMEIVELYLRCIDGICSTDELHEDITSKLVKKIINSDHLLLFSIEKRMLQNDKSLMFVVYDKIDRYTTFAFLTRFFNLEGFKQEILPLWQARSRWILETIARYFRSVDYFQGWAEHVCRAGLFDFIRSDKALVESHIRGIAGIYQTVILQVLQLSHPS